MGTRRSRHNFGHKPRYKEHWGEQKRAVDEYPRVGFLSQQKNFLESDEARSLSIESVRDLPEAECRIIFQRIRYFQNGGEPWCPWCGCTDLYYLTTRRMWRCKPCIKQFSMTSGTIFSSRKLSFKQLLMEIAIAVGRSRTDRLATSAEAAGLAYRSAHPMLRNIRQAIDDGRVLNPASPLSLEALLSRPRYVGGLELSTGTWWTTRERDALKILVSGGVVPGVAARSLGRSESSLKYQASELGLSVPDVWRIHQRRQREHAVALQYPYIVRQRDEHADLLAVNEIVPKRLPPHMRADICQEAMLAILEGRTSLEELKRRKDQMRWFVTKFYKDNFEQAGHAVSLTGIDGDGEDYDMLESSIARGDWEWAQMNEKRNAWDAVNNRFYPPTQIDAVYHGEIKREQRRLHHDGALVDYSEAESELTQIDPKSMRHMNMDFGVHAWHRLKDRYGINVNRNTHLELVSAANEGRVRVVEMQDDHTAVGWVRCQGRNVRVIVDVVTKKFITVLPPTDERMPWRERQSPPLPAVR